MFLLNLSAFEAFSWVVGFLVALTIHEAAHAAAANYLGDPTAKFAGRISLNPLAHLDIAGSIFLLLVGFGWGKPVPVNPRNFANPRVGNALTSLAGPISNLAVALILAIPYNFFTTPNSLLFIFLHIVIFVNIVILVFNILPIPPLDGGGVVASLLPPRIAESYERNGVILLFLLIGVGIAFNIEILWNILTPLIDIVWGMVNLATRFGG